MIKLSSKYVEKYDSISEQEKIKLKEIETIINEKASMLDWTDPNQTISQQDLEKIKEYTKKIQKRADLFLVIGIGGSYLGSKAVIEALSPYFSKKTPEVMFIGYHLSGTYLKELLNYITGKSIYVNVISKSGTTLETIACFEIIEKYMKENFSDYQDRIFVTTSNTNNHLTEIAIREHYHTLEIPENIGGRFSVLTPVGLFPIAVGGIDIQELLKGIPSNDEIFQLASRIALIRKHLEEDHKTVEAVTFYEKKLSSLSLWYQQLFAETQGKDEKGILPIPNFNTTNLHSIGQYFQDGKKQVFETVIKIEKIEPSVPMLNTNYDMNEFNQMIIDKICIAHHQGNTPSIILTLPNLETETLGHFLYLLELTATIGAYLLDMNPFDQPGVEIYKQEIKTLCTKHFCG